MAAIHHQFQQLQSPSPRAGDVSWDSFHPSNHYDASYGPGIGGAEKESASRTELDLRDIIDVSHYAELFDTCHVPNHGLPTPDDHLFSATFEQSSNDRDDACLDSFFDLSTSTLAGPATPPFNDYADDLVTGASTTWSNYEADSDLPWSSFADQNQERSAIDASLFPSGTPSGPRKDDLSIQQQRPLDLFAPPASEPTKHVGASPDATEPTYLSQSAFAKVIEQAVAPLQQNPTPNDSRAIVSKRKFTFTESSTSESGEDGAAPPKRARSSKASTHSPNAKRKDFLARNAGAARRTRQKKKDFVTGLEMKLRELEQQRVQLTLTIDPLLQEVSLLRALVGQHTQCGGVQALKSLNLKSVGKSAVPLERWNKQVAMAQSGLDAAWSESY